jgi:cell division protein FtsQ
MKLEKLSKRNKKVDHLFKRKVYVYLSSLKSWLKWIALLLAILLVYKNSSRIYGYLKLSFIELTADMGFRLNNIVIEGRQNFDVQQFLSNFSADNNTPIFMIDISNIKKTLDKEDWIKDSIVVRLLPNTIHIKIYEREPIAIWQYNKQLFLIDADGYAIRSDVQKFSHLLHFVGEGANIYAASFIKSFVDKPKLFNDIASIIRCGNRRWDLILKNGITVKLPEKDFESALDYLNKKYVEGKLFEQNIKTIDMRDYEKYYIEKY